MENLLIINEVTELEAPKKRCTLALDAVDKLNFLTTYLKIAENSFFDYTEHKFDDPEIPMLIVEEFLKKSIEVVEETKNIINGIK